MEENKDVSRLDSAFEVLMITTATIASITLISLAILVEYGKEYLPIGDVLSWVFWVAYPIIVALSFWAVGTLRNSTFFKIFSWISVIYAFIFEALFLAYIRFVNTDFLMHTLFNSSILEITVIDFAPFPLACILAEGVVRRYLHSEGNRTNAALLRLSSYTICFTVLVIISAMLYKIPTGWYFAPIAG